MSRMRPPLTTSMTGPSTTPSCSLMFSMSPHARSYWARFLERTRRPFLVLLLEHERLDLVAERDDLVRVDVVADRQLAGRDHALGLEADVEEDLVLVDLDDRALDDVAVFELDDGAGDGVLEGHAAEVVDRRSGAGVYSPPSSNVPIWDSDSGVGEWTADQTWRGWLLAFRTGAPAAGPLGAFEDDASIGTSQPPSGTRGARGRAASGVGAGRDRPDVLDARGRPPRRAAAAHAG